MAKLVIDLQEADRGRPHWLSKAAPKRPQATPEEKRKAFDRWKIQREKKKTMPTK